MSSVCPKGQILRRGYITKRGSKTIKVPSSCIKAQSQSGKKRSDIDKLFVLEKGVLGKFGYEDVRNMSQISRQTSLRSALKDIKPLSLYRRLNALYVLNKEKNKKLAKIFKNDAEWIKTTHAYMNRNTNRSSSKRKYSKRKYSKRKSSKRKSSKRK